LPAGSFDLVASSFVIHLLDQPAAGVAEAHRVLAPGGRFAVTSGSARQLSSREDASSSPLGARLDALLGEFARYLPPGGSMGQLVDAADLLDDAGFVDLREDPVGVSVSFADQAMLWRWMLTHGYRAFVEDLPEARRREFQQRVPELPRDERLLQRQTSVWSGRKPA
jgi:SAM-dependent methyltransferase